MNRLALRPTDMFIGHRAPIGTSIAMGCLCRNKALAPLIPFLGVVSLKLTFDPCGLRRLFRVKRAPTRAAHLPLIPM